MSTLGILSMRLPSLKRLWRNVWPIRITLLVLSLLLLSCQDGEDIDNLSPPPLVTPIVEQRSIENLLSLYRMALLQEDIDRLQALLQPGDDHLEIVTRGDYPMQRQREDMETFEDAQSFRMTISEDFRNLTILDIDIIDVNIQITSDSATASFLEVRSVEDPVLLEQRTRIIRTIFRISQSEMNGVVSLYISEVRRAGPHFEIITPGQILAGVPARIIVSEVTAMFFLDEVKVEVPDTGITQTLSTTDDLFHGFFIPPAQSIP